jgi:PAS domain-containing protein
LYFVLCIENNKNNIMDEFQFIESLDALLANEGIDEAGETVDATGEMANHVDVNNYNPVYDQGMLSGPMSVGVGTGGCGEWLPIPISNNSSTCNNTTTVQDPFASFYPTTTCTTMPSPQVAEASYPQQQYTSLVNNSTTTYSNIHVEQQQPAGTEMLSPAAVLSRQIPTSTVQAPSMTTVAPLSGATTMPVCSINSGSSKITKGMTTSGGGRSVGSATSAGTGGTSSSRKRSRKIGSSSMAVSDSEDEGSKRRSDRNLREQKRSQKITEQIDQLREVLAAASVRFKPDKFSTLISVVEYVKQLQTRSTMLDTEHKNLVDTISRTNEMVNESYLPASSATGGGGGSSHISSDNKTDCDTSLNAQPDSAVSSGGSDIYNDDEMVFVRNVDYRCIFDKCGMPLAVASIDGRLLDCNDEFLKLTRYSRKELLPTEYNQQASAVIADEVASSFSEDPPAFPDAPASNNDLSIIGSRTDDESNSTVTTSTTTTSNRIHLKQDQSVQQDEGDDKESTKDDDSEIPTRNFSLFDLLSRNHMEEVFVSLSQMLKRPPKDKVGTGAVTIDDHWWGNVHLNRNTDLEVRRIILSFLS